MGCEREEMGTIMGLERDEMGKRMRVQGMVFIKFKIFLFFLIDFKTITFNLNKIKL